MVKAARSAAEDHLMGWERYMIWVEVFLGSSPKWFEIVICLDALPVPLLRQVFFWGSWALLGSLWGSLGLPFELKGVTLGSRVLQNGSQEAPKTPKCSKKLPPRGRSGKISEKFAI